MFRFGWIGGLFLLAMTACAPRLKQTHYERWEAFAAASKQTANEESTSEPAAPAVSDKPVSKPVPPPPPPPKPPSETVDLTPPVETATNSRVVVPESSDGDLY